MRTTSSFKVIISCFTLLFFLTFTHNSFAQSGKNNECVTEVISTTLGPVCGTVISTSTRNEAEAFLGIPYGNTTANENRFNPPVPKDPWTSTLVANTFGTSCPTPQLTDLQSEDCLTLNVWRPDGTDENSKLSVMVWIYGGGFVSGSSDKPLYDGSYLAANEDIIIVSFNYRLGVMGFLATKELESNYGILDQQLALRWVKDNIKNFGGDPDKVTIFGESAGAMSVGTHLAAAPGSRDLFRAGIIQSNPFGLPRKSKEEAQQIGRVFQALLDCPDAECLREKTMQEIMEAQIQTEIQKNTVFPGFEYYLTWTPVIDGTVIVDTEDFVIDKPVMLGTNRDEGDLFERLIRISLGGITYNRLSFEEYIGYTASVFGNIMEKVVSKYDPKDKGDNDPLVSDLLTDYIFTCANRFLASTFDLNNQPVYTYRFTHVPSFNWLCLKDCEDRVCHTEEIAFVFHTADKLNRCSLNSFKTGYRFTEEEELISQEMMKYWTNFAKYLDPNGQGEDTAEFVWAPFTANNPNFMIFETFPLRAELSPTDATCDFWDSIGYFLKDPWKQNIEE